MPPLAETPAEHGRALLRILKGVGLAEPSAPDDGIAKVVAGLKAADRITVRALANLTGHSAGYPHGVDGDADASDGAAAAAAAAAPASDEAVVPVCKTTLAVAQLERAAQKGSAYAMYIQARWLESGYFPGDLRDRGQGAENPKVRELLSRVKRTVPAACFHLSQWIVRYDKTLRISDREEEADKLLEEGAKGGDPNCLNQRAIKLFLAGDRASIEQARRYWTQASEAGHAVATSNLAWSFVESQAAAAARCDNARAVDLIKKAATMGVHYAPEVDLALARYFGINQNADLKSAFDNMTKAIMHGDAMARIIVPTMDRFWVKRTLKNEVVQNWEPLTLTAIIKQCVPDSDPAVVAKTLAGLSPEFASLSTPSDLARLGDKLHEAVSTKTKSGEALPIKVVQARKMVKAGQAEKAKLDDIERWQEEVRARLAEFTEIAVEPLGSTPATDELTSLDETEIFICTYVDDEDYVYRVLDFLDEEGHVTFAVADEGDNYRKMRRAASAASLVIIFVTEELLADPSILDDELHAIMHARRLNGRAQSVQPIMLATTARAYPSWRDSFPGAITAQMRKPIEVGVPVELALELLQEVMDGIY